MKTTPLYNLHLELGARLTPFAGYAMPLQYAGIRQEHLHTRTRASLFDVSHMGLLRITGTAAGRVLERLVPAAIRDLAEGRQRYTVLLNEAGGVYDDLIVTRLQNDLYLVVNASRKEYDLDYLQQHGEGDCGVEALPDRALLALQGPEAAVVLAHYLPLVCDLKFMQAGSFEFMNGSCMISRSGYTGEDGFEIAVTGNHAEKLARTLLSHPAVKPAGLGARDTLRLEAGLSLYGHELDETTSPVEAGLSWTIAKTRLEEKTGFPGYERIAAELSSGPSRLRVGLRVDGRIPVRENAELLNADGRVIGKITSGGFAPTLNAAIAMGYVEIPYTKAGTELRAMVRNKACGLRVARLPFVAHRYIRQ